MRKLLVLAAFAAGVLLVALLALACGRGAVDSVIDASVTLLPARPPEPNLGSSYPTCQNTTALGGVPWVVGGHQQTVCAQPDAGLEVLVALADGGWEWLPYAGGGGSASFADGSGIPLVVDGASAGNLACTNGQLVMADGGAGYWVCGPTAAQVFTAGGDLSGSATSQTVDGLQGRTLSANAPVECNNLQWDGGSWGPSSVNLAGGSSCVIGTLAIANGGTNQSGPGASGTVLRCDGGTCAWLAIQSSDLTTPLTTCPPIGGTTASTGAFTSLTTDAGLDLGLGSNGPYRIETAVADLYLDAGLQTIVTYTPTVMNQVVEISGRYLCPDMSALDGGALNHNLQGCSFDGYVFVEVDGGLMVSTLGQGVAFGVPLACSNPACNTGCTSSVGDAGCSPMGSACNLITAQLVVSGASALIQIEYVDASTTTTSRCSVIDGLGHRKAANP